MDKTRTIFTIALLLIGVSSLPLFGQTFLFSESGSNKPERVFLFATGSLIMVESALLLAGMNLPAPGSWSHPVNLTLGTTDVLMGAGLIAYALYSGDPGQSPLYWTLIGLLTATHLYRDYQYAAVPDPFCFNTPLLVLNNIRLGLLAASGGISLAYSY